jgi:hypothetical protein
VHCENFEQFPQKKRLYGSDCSSGLVIILKNLTGLDLLEKRELTKKENADFKLMNPHQPTALTTVTPYLSNWLHPCIANLKQM